MRKYKMVNLLKSLQINRSKIQFLVAVLAVLSFFSANGAISADISIKPNSEVTDFFDASMYIGVKIDNIDKLPQSLTKNRLTSRYNDFVGWKFRGGGRDFFDKKHPPGVNKLSSLNLEDSQERRMFLLLEETGRQKTINGITYIEDIVRDAIGFRAGLDDSSHYPEDLELCSKVTKSGDHLFFIGKERVIRDKKGKRIAFEINPVLYAWRLDRDAVRFVRTSVEGIHCRAYLDI